MTAPYWGKYRGTVVNNVDPERRGRLQVSCPRVLGENVLSWAMPCVPFAGPFEGFYMMPSLLSNVWIEFEAGDPDRPIWVGGFWTDQSIPPAAATPLTRTITTVGGMSLTLDDAPGSAGFRLMAGPPLVSVPCIVTAGVTGITITTVTATVSVTSAGVDINNGALRVLP